MPGHIVCVDLGGTRLRTALFDTREPTLRKKLVSATPRNEPEQSVVRNMKRAIEELLQDVSDPVQAVIVGSPGPLDIDRGVVIHAPLFQDAQDIPIADEISEAFGVKTWVQNDANLAALGEYAYGAGRGSSVMVYMGIGTGIGGGIVINGQLLTGAKGYAGEIGHICVEPDGLFCGCGRRGCLEAYASGRAIEAEAYRVVHQGVITRLKYVLDTTGGIRVQDIVLLASEGDSIAQSILHRAAKLLGIGLASVVNLLNPDCVVIGGGVSNAGAEFIDTIRRCMVAQAVFPMCEQVELVHCELGDEAGLYGGCYYGRQMLGIELADRF